MPNSQILNRLINEKSPYLLQHAHNPVDWYPWSEEALKKAEKEDKPIFLSIGYSSCHWCHVIAHESFEDHEVAGLLNRAYVPVKVDKEERPDVDAVYMAACVGMTGSGGWPTTILALPDGSPFFAATYLPKHELLRLLAAAESLWQTDRPHVLQMAKLVTQSLRRSEGGRDGEAAVAGAGRLAGEAFEHFYLSFDKTWGGFGAAPKFPSPHNLLFLMTYFERTGTEKALAMVEGTLESMYKGGIFDHIGGGFCRYATDRRWLIPHFEKMLYDNAMLLWAYARAYALTGRPLYKRAGEMTAAYVLSEMTSPEGAFYGSQDADSGSEGAYYVMTPKEIDDQLGDKDGKKFCDWFDITKGGNFEGKSIPNLIGNRDYEAPDPWMDELRDKIYQWRLRRMPLGRDDKVLTAWNALMIIALCEASERFHRQDYRQAAEKAAQFLQTHLRGNENRLLIRWREGEAKGVGIADDYAFFALALLKLGRSQEAAALADMLEAHFWDREEGGLYLYADDAQQLFLRPKETYDGALPSGNAAFLHVLTALCHTPGGEKWRALREKQTRFLAAQAAGNPAGYAFSLIAMLENPIPSAI